MTLLESILNRMFPIFTLICHRRIFAITPLQQNNWTWKFHNECIWFTSTSGPNFIESGQFFEAQLCPYNALFNIVHCCVLHDSIGTVLLEYLKLGNVDGTNLCPSYSVISDTHSLSLMTACIRVIKIWQWVL